MNPETKATLREDFVCQTYKVANRTHDSLLLFDAGDLGFCLLEWGGKHWWHMWFDEARQLSPSRRERLGEKVPRITRPARFADQDGGKS